MQRRLLGILAILLAVMLVACDSDSESLNDSTPPHVTFSNVEVTSEAADKGFVHVSVRAHASSNKEISYTDLPAMYIHDDQYGYDYRLSFSPDDDDLRGTRWKANEIDLVASTSFRVDENTTVSCGINEPETKASHEGIDSAVENIANDVQAVIPEAVEIRLNAEEAETQKPAPTQADPSEVTCFVTPTGHSYHSGRNCPRLKQSSEIYETTVGEAKAEGYDSCDWCH